MASVHVPVSRQTRSGSQIKQYVSLLYHTLLKLPQLEALKGSEARGQLPGAHPNMQLNLYVH